MILTVEESLPEERDFFIRSTFLNLAIGILVFTGLETILLNSNIPRKISLLFNGHWFLLVTFILLLLVLFLIARSLAKSENLITQYIGFSLYIFTQVILCAPILYNIQSKVGVGIIEDAGIIATGLFLGITAIAFLSHKDFSFLKPITIVISFLLLAFIIAGLVFGFWLRSFFTLILVGLAGIWILINTSTLVRRYSPTQHVAASISLFSTLLFLFWAILRAYSAANKLQNSNSDSKETNSNSN